MANLNQIVLRRKPYGQPDWIKKKGKERFRLALRRSHPTLLLRTSSQNPAFLLDDAGKGKGTRLARVIVFSLKTAAEFPFLALYENAKGDDVTPFPKEKNK